MLLQLRVKNFRKLRDKTFDFTSGLNVVRGANEQGKSTMLEAIKYAFEGVKGCRSPLEDLVTWSEKVSSLKVELDFIVEGITYRLKRSKSGAEVNWTVPAMIYTDQYATPAQEGSVVGQTEVTAFIGRLLGVSMGSVNNLMFANQGAIRGALAEGSKKTSELIEDLADFDVIDKIVTLIGEKLLVGATQPFEDKVARLAPELEAVEAALAEVPDTATAEAALKGLEPQLAAGEAEVQAALIAIDPAAAARDAAKKLLEQRGQWQARVDLLKGQVQTTYSAYTAIALNPPPTPDTARAEEIQKLLADAAKIETLRSTRREIEALLPPANAYECTVEEFNAETNTVKSRSQAIQGELSNLTAEAREKRAQRVAASACGMCGKDVSEFPEVAQKNRAIDVRLAEIIARETALRTELQTLVGELHELELVYNDHSKVERLVARYGDLVAVDRAYVPWRLSWGGPEIPDNDNGQALRLELAAVRAAETARTVWVTREQYARQAREDAQKALDEATAALQHPDYTAAEAALPGLEAECDRLNTAYSNAVQAVYGVKDTVNLLRLDVAQKRGAYEAAKAKAEQVKHDFEEAKDELVRVTKNNALLKRVRVARPIIANNLWSLVLSAVSRYFSQMRGEESVVTKDADGFKVNMKLIENLSGSALDLLGLSIRLALVRTFLPAAPFLILDEPASACSDERTTSMMSFLVACGFDQMLVVTHEDLSEQVASSLIEI